MKHLVIVYDGMADRKIPSLGNKTPMEVAKKPMMDSLTRYALCGTVSNVPEGMVPESDTANLAILSYDPKVYSKGRSPLEAVSMGIDMRPDEVAYRCNVVTLSDDEDYDNKIMLDHSADEITTEEADALIKTLEEKVEMALYELRLAVEDKGEAFAIPEARKKIALYFKGFRGSAHLRAGVNAATTYAEAERIIHGLLREENE